MLARAPDPSPTPAVGLRPALPGDAERLRHWRSEASVQRFQPLGEVSSRRLRRELSDQHLPELYEGRGDKFQWIIEADERPAGWITLVVTNWEHGLAEVGYALSTPFQHRGIMAVALELLLRDLFGRTELGRLEARCAVGNAASRKVLEKTGFRREGRLRGYFLLHGKRVDNYLYAILREDFEEGGGSS